LIGFLDMTMRQTDRQTPTTMSQWEGHLIRFA